MIARLNAANAAVIQRLAAKTGVNVDLTVNWILEKALGTAKGAPKRGRRALLTDEDKEQVRRQRREGMGYEALAKLWNVSVPTIRRACGSLKTPR